MRPLFNPAGSPVTVAGSDLRVVHGAGLEGTVTAGGAQHRAWLGSVSFVQSFVPETLRDVVKRWSAKVRIRREWLGAGCPSLRVALAWQRIDPLPHVAPAGLPDPGAAVGAGPGASCWRLATRAGHGL